MRILWILKDKRVIQNIFQKGLFWNKFDKYVNHIHVAFATNILIIVLYIENSHQECFIAFIVTFILIIDLIRMQYTKIQKNQEI